MARWVMSPQLGVVTRAVIVTDRTDPTIVISDPPDFFPAGPFILDPGETEIEISWPVGAEDLETRLSISCSVGGPPELISPVGTEYVDGVLTATFSYDFGPGPTSVTCTVMEQGGNTTTSDPFLVTVISVIDVILSVETDDDGGTTATVFESELIANITATDLSISCLATDSAEFEVGLCDQLTVRLFLPRPKRATHYSLLPSSQSATQYIAR